ncbi:hypothetical protein [Ursidibacter arcticus]
MSFLNIPLNCSRKCEAWEDILSHYNDWVADDEVWEIARQSEKPPILGNIYQRLVLDRILSHFCEETGKDESDLTLFYYVNSIDTHLVINEWDICTEEDYWGCVEKHRITYTQ